jgi:hypothetical protein
LIKVQVSFSGRNVRCSSACRLAIGNTATKREHGDRKMNFEVASALQFFSLRAVQPARGGLCSDTQEFSMSKKEPKSAKNTSAQEAVENLFHPKASGNAKKHAEGAKKPRKKGS